MKMTDYKDVIQWVKTSNGKPRANRLGSAKEVNGKLYVKLDMLPIPAKNNFDELTVELVIQERRERGEDGSYAQSPPPAQDAAPAAPSDDIPF